MDSLALAWWLRPPYAFTVDYGQAAAAGEVRAAVQACAELGIAHEVLVVDASSLGSGDLAGRPPLAAAPVREWWPFRNQFLLTVAGMRAVALGVQRLLAGSVAADGAHRDGTAAFYDHADRLFAMQEGGIRIEAPAIALTTAALVRRAGAPRSFMAWAHSCHTGPFACGACRGCWKQAEVEAELWATP
jgi:7-cyano-7-deazaguanine synthase